MMRRIPPAELEAFVEQLLRAFGTPQAPATDVAANLVRADLRGHGSHGTRLLPGYAELVEGDKIRPSASPTIEDNGTILQVDGNGAFGQYIGAETLVAALERADVNGRCVAGIRNGAHLGRIGEFAERAAEAGFLFATFVNGPQEVPVVPPGSNQIRLCTNPIAFSIPTFGALSYPIVLDMATSQVALGKIKRRQASGDSIPDDWAVSNEGEPITNPDRFDKVGGRLLPLGGRSTGHKGYGLAIIAELFAGIFGAGHVLGERANKWGNGAAMLVFDPCRILPKDGIEDRVTTLANHLKAAGDDVKLPGEPEHRAQIRNRENGVPIPEKDAIALREIALEYDIAESTLPAEIREV